MRRIAEIAFGGTTALLLLIGAGPAEAEGLEEVREFHIEAQPLDAALIEFSEQADLQLVVQTELVAGRESTEVDGALTTGAALLVLLNDTGLQFEAVGEDTVAVSPAHARGDSEPGNGRTAGATQTRVPEIQNDGSNGSSARQQDQAIDRTTDAGSYRETLEEIVVTGTNIRGIAPVGAQLFVIDRSVIDKLGVGSAQEIVRILPQNFNGGVGGEDRRISAGGTPINAAGGAGVNLRGLGGDSTLVLVNGRRLPQGASPAGQFVDVSSVPLVAIERVEVLADGASALYGSDAVAGVVNFVLRDDYEGAETRLRYGTVTSGSLDEFQASQVLGRNIGRANVLVGYEYSRKDPLPAAEREYAANGDLSRFGAPNAGSSASNPANIDQVIFPDGSTQSVVFAIPEGQDGIDLQPAELLAGVVNLRNVNEGRWLLASHERHSAFLTSAYEVSPAVRAYGEFRYTNRAFEVRQTGETVTDLIVPNGNPYFVTPVAGATAVRIDYNMIDDLGPRTNVGDVETIAGVLGFSAEIGNDWRLDAYGAYSRETTEDTANVVHRGRLAEALGVDDPLTPFDPAVGGYLNPFADGSNTDASVLAYVQGFDDSKQKADLWTVRGQLDGALFPLPGGDVRIAVGSEYRDEGRATQGVSFDTSIEPVATEPNSLGRNVFAAFAEAYIPLFSERNARPGLQELTLSIAGRYERYSDFGSSVDPKVGVSWSPMQGLTFRGTYGTSYKAPLLTDFGESYVAIIFPIADPENTVTGSTVALVLQGENPALEEEMSTSWTVGFDVQPAFSPALRIEGTLFSVDFRDQIGMLPASPFSALVFPEIFSSVTTRDADPAMVQAFIDGADVFLDLGGGAPAEVLVDARITNLAVTEIRGLDLSLHYDLATDAGHWTFGLNASRLFEYKQASAATTPLLELVDTLNNPLGLRLRGSIGWSKDRISSSVFVNYADDYLNPTRDPVEKIDAWTTVDLQLRYDLGGAEIPLLEGVSLALNVQNLLDEDPPFAIDGALNIGLAYDSENADPLGRFASLQLTKRW